MGVHDRDYMRAGPRRSWLPGKVTWWLIGIHVVLWFVHAASLNSAQHRDPFRSAEADSPVATFIERELVLHTNEVFGSLKLWQPFTAFWFHDWRGMGQLFWNMLLLFFFGRAVESTLGAKRYFWLYVGGGATAMLVSTGFAYLTGMHGEVFSAHGALYAVLVWLACREPSRTIMVLFVVPAPLWVAVGLFMLGGELVDVIVLGSVKLTVVGHAAAAAWGWFFYRRFARYDVAKPRKVRPRNDAQEPETGGGQPDPAAGVKQEVDRLLAKIAAEGMESLTEEEKAFLQQASKRYK